MKAELNVSQESGSTICNYGGWGVNQHYYNRTRRFYVHLPKHSGLREKYKDRTRMLRSHFVIFVRDSINEIPHGMVVHHIDGDRLNDAPENLLLMTSADHDKLHREEPKKESLFKGEFHTQETLKKMRSIAINRGNNSIWNHSKKNHSEGTKALMSDRARGSGNAAFRKDLDDEEIKEFFRQCGNITRTAAHFKCSNTAVRNRVRGVEPIIKLPPSKMAKSLKEIVCYIALNGMELASKKYEFTEEELRMKVMKFKGYSNENH